MLEWANSEPRYFDFDLWRAEIFVDRKIQDVWEAITEAQYEDLKRFDGAKVTRNAMGAEFIYIGVFDVTVGGKVYHDQPRLVATMVPERTPLCRGRTRER